MTEPKLIIDGKVRQGIKRYYNTDTINHSFIIHFKSWVKQWLGLSIDQQMDSPPIAIILVGFVPIMHPNLFICCSVAYGYNNINGAIDEVTLSLPTGLSLLGILELLLPEQKPSLKPIGLPISGSLEVTPAGDISLCNTLINGEHAVTEFRANVDIYMRKELLEVVMLPEAPVSSMAPNLNQNDVLRALEQFQSDGKVTTNDNEDLAFKITENCNSILTVRKWAGVLPHRAGYEDKRCVYVKAAEGPRGILTGSVCYSYWGDSAHKVIGPSLLQTLQRCTRGIGVSSSVSVYKPHGVGHCLCLVDADISTLYRERLARLWGCSADEFDYKHSIRRAPDYLETPLYMLPDADLSDVNSDGHLLCSGPFDYFHTTEDKVWGIGHRAAQIILSWYQHQGAQRAVPHLCEIEEVLQKVDPHGHRAERQPIGTIEIFQLIFYYTAKQSRILHVSDDPKKIGDLGPELVEHFGSPNAPPVYFGSGNRSCIVAGIDTVPNSRRVRRFLVVDPRCTSGEVNGKDLMKKGLVGWKGVDYWSNSGQKFVNVLLPSS